MALYIPNNNNLSFDLDLLATENGEPLVSLSKVGIMCKPYYYMQGIPYAISDCYVRETVAKMLLQVQKSLQNEYKLCIYDGYRPIEVQQYLWNKQREFVKTNNINLSDIEIDKQTSIFVSKPSYDIYRPSLHNTGGAVDLTIIDKNGIELNMGTVFDDFSDMAWTNYFENNDISPEVRKNRRLLYWSMINNGFVNLPSEWWHYDFGDRVWAIQKNESPMYCGQNIYE